MPTVLQVRLCVSLSLFICVCCQSSTCWRVRTHSSLPFAFAFADRDCCSLCCADPPVLAFNGGGNARTFTVNAGYRPSAFVYSMNCNGCSFTFSYAVSPTAQAPTYALAANGAGGYLQTVNMNSWFITGNWTYIVTVTTNWGPVLSLTWTYLVVRKLSLCRVSRSLCPPHFIVVACSPSNFLASFGRRDC